MRLRSRFQLSLVALLLPYTALVTWVVLKRLDRDLRDRIENDLIQTRTILDQALLLAPEAAREKVREAAKSPRLQALAALKDLRGLGPILRETASSLDARYVELQGPEGVKRVTWPDPPPKGLAAGLTLAVGGEKGWNTFRIHRGVIEAVFTVPIEVQGGTVGYLQAHIPIGEGFLKDLSQKIRGECALVLNGKIAATTLPDVARLSPEELAAAAGQGPGAAPAVARLGGETYALQRVPVVSHEGAVLELLAMRPVGAFLRFRDGMRAFLLAVSLLFLAAGAVVLRRLARGIVGPVEELSRAAERFGQGDLDLRVAALGKDELGRLASTFNRMADALQSAQAQLLQTGKLAALGELSAGISHELASPMAVIQGECELLLMEKLEPAVSQALTTVLDAVHRCQEVQRALLSFARQEKLLLRPVELPPLVDASLKLLRHATKPFTVERRFSAETFLVEASPNHFQQVLTNIIANACQAMAPGGKLTISARAEGPWGVLEIADTGPGVPRELREKIFESFFTTKPAGKGTGLGLSICKGIMEKHGGSIEVDDAKGGGALFRLKLKLAGQPTAPPAQTASVKA